MAVPRKRKKLADTSEKLKKKASPLRQRRQRPKAEKALSRNVSEKIDTAFEIMDHIKEEPSADMIADEETATASTNATKSVSTLERLGFRFHISLDAVMPEKRTGSKEKSSILDIGLTIPFFWRMPIIGGIAQKVIRNIKTFKI